MHRFRYVSSVAVAILLLGATILYIAGVIEDGLQVTAIGLTAAFLAALTAWQHFLGSRELGRVLDERSAELARKTEDSLNRQRFESTLLASLAEGVVACDENGRYVYVNDAAIRLQGFEPDEVTLEHFVTTRRLVDEDGTTDLPDDQVPLRRCLREGDLTDQHVKFLHRDGSVRDALYTAKRIVRDDGQIRGAVLVFRDVTEMVELTRELQLERDRLAHLSEHDELTGLYNRRVFERRLEEQVAMADRYGPTGALLMIDIDDLKEVNDSYGHAAGDKLIAAVADAMRSRLRETDVICRIGGDEFAVMLPRVDRVHAEMAAESLLRCINKHVVPVTKNSMRTATASIGVALLADVEEPTTGAFKAAADSALYAAKRRGRNCVVLHDNVTEHYTAA